MTAYFIARQLLDVFCSTVFEFSFVFPQGCIVFLKLACMHIASSPRRFPGLPLEQYQCWYSSAQIIPDLGGWNIGCISSSVLSPPGRQYCDALLFSLLGEFLKPVNTSAMPSQRPGVVWAALASLSLCSSLTLAWPG